MERRRGTVVRLLRDEKRGKGEEGEKEGSVPDAIRYRRTLARLPRG